MKALTYQGSRDVRVQDVPEPRLQDDDDVIVRVTSTAICGSDLHLFRGKVPRLEKGDVLGHEFMGIVESVGKAVDEVQPGDRVVVPFTISCGECRFCAKGLFACCARTNPDKGLVMQKAAREALKPGAGMFGYTHAYGGYPGGQAEYVRVPMANTGPLKIPDGVPDEKVLFLSDILPTGYQAIVNAGVEDGSTIAIFGAGPVGCMAAACAKLAGAGRIFVVDHHEERLAFAQDAYGAEPIDFDRDQDVASVLLAATDGIGVDAAVDAVGFEAKGSVVDTVLAAVKAEGSSPHVLRECIAATRRGGTVSVPGVYAGPVHGFPFGDAFEKGITFKMGQTHVQRFMPELLELVLAGKLHPEAIITHRLPLAEAARGYEMFDKKTDGCRKVVLTAQA